MPDDRTQGRRSGRRAFRPTLNGTYDALEPRRLLSRVQFPTPGPIRFQVGANGSRLRVIDTDAEVYDIILEGPGAIRGTRARGGRVNLFFEGTTQASIATINPVRVVDRQIGHTPRPGAARKNNILPLNAVTVTSGEIGQILGYQTAALNGPLVVSGPQAVNRIALKSINPGGSIQVGGTLNTLDILDGMALSAGPGVVVGRDLNSLSVGQDITISNGANLTIGRDLGLTFQPAKGTGPSGQGAVIQGNVTIDPGSQFAIVRDLVGNLVIQGNLTGASRLSIGGGGGQVFIRGTITP